MKILFDIRFIVYICVLVLTICTVTTEARHRRSFDSDPCLDSEEINDTSTVSFAQRFDWFNDRRPWRKSGVKVYKGQGISYQWAWMKSLPVRGLPNRYSMEDVLNDLTSRGCLMLAVGPTVHDLLLKQQPVSMTFETSCTIDMIYQLCSGKFGESACAIYEFVENNSVNYRLEIGNASQNKSLGDFCADPLDIYEWGMRSLRKTEEMGYTIDSMTIYDDMAGNIYLTDLTGRGKVDACSRKIQPASQRLDHWSESRPEKILDYYILRSNGFSVASQDFHLYVNKLIKETISNETLAKFYCERVLKGLLKNGENNTPVCYLVHPTSEALKQINVTQNVMKHELDGTYNETIGSIIDRMEAVFKTHSQFAAMRDEVLQRKTFEKAFPKRNRGMMTRKLSTTTKPPAVIIEGKPMINDVSDVHLRPVISKTKPTNELPPDYPSAPKAKPNEKNEFVDAHKEYEKELMESVVYDTVVEPDQSLNNKDMIDGGVELVSEPPETEEDTSDVDSVDFAEQFAAEEYDASALQISSSPYFCPFSAFFILLLIIFM